MRSFDFNGATSDNKKLGECPGNNLSELIRSSETYLCPNIFPLSPEIPVCVPLCSDFKYMAVTKVVCSLIGRATD